MYILTHYLEVLPPDKARTSKAHALRNTLAWFRLLGIEAGIRLAENQARES
jgi:hypothetical protein